MRILEDYGEWLYNEDIAKGKATLNIKGHNLKEEQIKKLLEEEFCDEENQEVIILFTREQYYYCTRYFNGDDSKELGYNYWLNFTDEKKKTYGKCTEVTFKITNYPDI